MFKERLPLIAVLALLILVRPTTAAVHHTANFTVRAKSAEVARQVGEAAERYRKKFALLWLGKEMPKWGQPCSLRVTVTTKGSGGATEFTFDRGSILSQNMHIEGPLERLLSSVLPHEVAHTVFAYHFRQPLPRWADEGGARPLRGQERACPSYPPGAQNPEDPEEGHPASATLPIKSTPTTSWPYTPRASRCPSSWFRAAAGLRFSTSSPTASPGLGRGREKTLRLCLGERLGTGVVDALAQLQGRG